MAYSALVSYLPVFADSLASPKCQQENIESLSRTCSHAAGLAHPLPTRQPGIDSQTAGLAPGCGAVGMEEDPVDARCAIGAFALFAVAFGGPRHAAAEGAGGVGVVTTLKGEATVARVTLTQPL